MLGRLFLVIALLAGCGPTGKGGPTRLTTKDLVARVKPSVVRIESAIDGRRAQGSGFVVASDGRIATNLHVILGADRITVTLLDGSQHAVERVLAFDPQRDLAIVTIRRAGLRAVTLGNSDEVSAGDPVVAIGNPLGVFDFTVSDGLISSIRPIAPGLVALQISAPISQGSSGGPLFNAAGEVIGIATFISREGQNLNFGVPGNYLKPMLASAGRGETVAEFTAHVAAIAARGGSPSAEAGPSPSGKRIARQVPQHPLALLDGCTAEQMLEVFKAMAQAIEVGAPVYNRGEHEACFVIYRAVADRFEAEAAMCKGVREAFGQGLLRAGSTEDFTAKAWAIRDTFDGLTDVIVRKASAETGAPP